MLTLSVDAFHDHPLGIPSRTLRILVETKYIGVLYATRKCSNMQFLLVYHRYMSLYHIRVHYLAF